MIFKQAQVDKYLKKPDLGVKCFVVYGSNEGLVAETTRSLILSVSKDLYDPFSVAYLNAPDEGTLTAEYNSQSLMGGRRVVVIRDATDSLTKSLKKLFDESKSDTLLVLSSLSLAKRSSLVKMAEERSDCVAAACYEDRDEDVYATARAVFVANGCTIANEALALLCARLSSDRKSNLSEIEKLLVYIGDRRNITLEDVKAVVSDVSSSKVEDICYFTVSGETQKALDAFTRVINEGDEPVSIIRAVSYHVNRIVQCKAFMEKGETLEKAMFKLVPKIIFFREASFKKQVTVWPKERLFDVLDLLYKCERDCKTTNMPPEELASYCLMQIGSAAGKLGR